MRTSLDWLLSLAGELKDGSEASMRFRQSIESEKVSPTDYRGWIGDALRGSGVQMAYAFQDLINALGKRLGAEVEYRTYQERGGYNGLWGIGMGRYIIADSTTTYAYPVDGVRVNKLITEVSLEKRTPFDNVSLLIVMGGADTGAMADAVYSKGLQKKVRVAVWEDLIRLIELKSEGVLTGSQIADLLFPFEAIDIGKILRIVEPIARGLPKVMPVPEIKEPEVVKEEPKIEPKVRSIVEKYEADKSGEFVLTDKQEIMAGSPAEEIAYKVLAGSESKSPRRKVIVRRYIKKP
jgi:hypothetical protein